jgi:hypothetical protein
LSGRIQEKKNEKISNKKKDLQIMRKTTKTAPTGHLAQTFGDVSLPLQPLLSAAGWYLGTKDAEGFPHSRESVEYWKSREQAEAALHDPSSWTQRCQP